MSGESATRDRILDAAERLFAERGIAGTSLRAVTAEAAANVAAVHYHFGSKEDLAQAVVQRRAEPVNRERLRLLDAAEASAAPDPPTLEGVLAAFFGPPVSRWAEDGVSALSLLLQEPPERVGPLVASVMAEVSERFVAALARALPHLPPDEVAERMHLLVGVLVHVVSGRMRWSLHPLPERSVEGTVSLLVQALAAALRTPSLKEES